MITVQVLEEPPDLNPLREPKQPMTYTNEKSRMLLAQYASAASKTSDGSNVSIHSYSSCPFLASARNISLGNLGHLEGPASPYGTANHSLRLPFSISTVCRAVKRHHEHVISITLRHYFVERVRAIHQMIQPLFLLLSF